MSPNSRGKRQTNKQYILVTLPLLIPLVNATGWYFTDLNQSCDEKCAAVGPFPFATERTDLICTQNNFDHVQNNLVNAMEDGWTTCVAIEDDSFTSSSPFQNTDGRCKYRQTGTQIGSISSANYRICCCAGDPNNDCSLPEAANCIMCFLGSHSPFCVNTDATTTTEAATTTEATTTTEASTTEATTTEATTIHPEVDARSRQPLR